MAQPDVTEMPSLEPQRAHRLDLAPEAGFDLHQRLVVTQMDARINVTAAYTFLNRDLPHPAGVHRERARHEMRMAAWMRDVERNRPVEDQMLAERAKRQRHGPLQHDARKARRVDQEIARHQLLIAVDAQVLAAVQTRH